MRLLLDTHAFLWFIGDDPSLSVPARMAIEDSSNEALLSVASVWEMAIKTSLGRLALEEPFAPFIRAQMRQNDIALLDISLDHVAALVNLPFHHRDPFARLLITQALIEGIPVVSRDQAFDAYPVRRLW